MKVGIIGGTGGMGQFFKKIFESEKHEVFVSGRNTELSIEECARKSDIVIISVPMDVTNGLIKQVSKYLKKDSLLIDLTSLKVGPMKVMKEHCKCNYLGAHPVFGPGVGKMKNQTIVLCPGKGKKWLNWMERFFQSQGAKVKIATAKEHDKMMSVIQGIIHFSSITVSHALKMMDIDIDETQAFSSPIYKLRMDMVGRILNQDPELYANIEIMNPEVPKALNVYLKTCRTLYNTIKSKDKEGFVKYFNEAADHLGDFKNEAEEYSDYLIEKLVEKG